MPYQNELKKFLKEQEGFSDTSYLDHKGNETIGYGANLDSPGTKTIMAAAGIDKVDTPEAATRLMEAQVKEKERLIKSRIPQFDTLPAEQKAAAMSLMYNSPKLVGPRLSKLINQGNAEEAAKEILLRSNKDQMGGVTKRRMEEAAMFTGGKLPTITPEEQDLLENQIKSIENPHEREKVFLRLRQLLANN